VNHHRINIESMNQKKGKKRKKCLYVCPVWLWFFAKICINQRMQIEFWDYVVLFYLTNKKESKVILKKSRKSCIRNSNLVREIRYNQINKSLNKEYKDNLQQYEKNIIHFYPNRFQCSCADR